MSVSTNEGESRSFSSKARTVGLTGNVQLLLLLLVLIVLLFLFIRTRKIFSGQRLLVHLRVADGDQMDIDTTTAMQCYLVAERLEKGREQEAKDPFVVVHSGRAAILALHVHQDLVHTIRRRVDQNAPWHCPEELNKEFSLEAPEKCSGKRFASVDEEKKMGIKKER